MAKKKTNNNDLFASFKIDKPTEKKIDVENKSEPTPVAENVVPSISAEDIKPIEPVQAAQFIDDMAFAMPRSGRPKTLDGKYHIYTARIREDLFEYAQSRTGKDKEFQSVNDYINRLIARDMLSRN